MFKFISRTTTSIANVVEDSTDVLSISLKQSVQEALDDYQTEVDQLSTTQDQRDDLYRRLFGREPTKLPAKSAK